MLSWRGHSLISGWLSNFYSKGDKNKVGLVKQLIRGLRHPTGTLWSREKHRFLLILPPASSASITVWVVLSQPWDDFYFLTVEEFWTDTWLMRRSHPCSDLCGRFLGSRYLKDLEAETWGRNKLDSLKRARVAGGLWHETPSGTQAWWCPDVTRGWPTAAGNQLEQAAAGSRWPWWWFYWVL